ncbi:MAG: DUF1552 domain-containing protein [Polyangiaceae bacterium]|nr:DUF1552 domain-containing protein [Polyangiaceae bacterium]
MPSISRRKWLAGAGASLVAASFLKFLTGESRADSPTVAKRLVVVFTPNGTVHKHWRPTGSETNFTFAPGSILEPLAAHKSKLLVCDGIDYKSVDNHEGGMANMLTGGGGVSSSSGGMSVDQFVASKLGQSTKFSSLEFGVQTSAWGGNVQTRMSYLAPGVYAPPDDSPASVYKRMFGDLSTDPADVDKLLARKKAVIDLVNGEIKDLQKRVGKAEKDKLEAHLAALQKVESSLGAVSSPTCEAPGSVFELDPYNNQNFPAVGKAQMDLLVLALACGMTNVASLQWNHTVGPAVFSWVGVTEGHHSLSHMDDSNVQGVADFVKTERWYAEQFAYLLSSLAAVPDPAGGTLLDSTLVVWCKELGDGRLHDCKNVPWVLAGAKCFSMGRYVNFGGEPHQKLLVSICQALGLTNQTFGDASKGQGPLEGLIAS